MGPEAGQGRIATVSPGGVDGGGRVIRLEDADGMDQAYWRSRAAEERLAALEPSRQIADATIRLPADVRDFLRLLNSHRVEYRLVGGYAVCFHGY